jgi:DNA polymerase III subunit beta
VHGPGRVRPGYDGGGWRLQFSVDSKSLSDAVGWVARSVPARPAVPVLAGLRIRAGDDILVLDGTDQDVTARAELPADVVEPGTALVPGRRLAEVVRALPRAPVTAAADGPRLRLGCGGVEFALVTQPLYDYPEPPRVPEPAGTVDGPMLAAAVEQVAVVAGRDETLAVLTGIRVTVGGGTLTLAATDRYRFAVRELPWEPARDGVSLDVLVPAGVLRETARALAGGPVTVAVSELGTEPAPAARRFSRRGGGGDGPRGQLLALSGSGRRATTRLLDGELPDARRFLPTSFSAVATVDTAALAEAVRRVALVAEGNDPVHLDFSADGVTVRAGSGDQDEASATLPARLHGEQMAVAFNPGWLVDALSAVGTEVTRLSLTTPAKPALLTGDGAEGSGGSYRHVLMPLRLRT